MIREGDGGEEEGRGGGERGEGIGGFAGRTCQSLQPMMTLAGYFFV